MVRVILILLLCSLITSCEKECGGNCAEITIVGQVVSASTNQGIEKVPIAVYWQSSGFGFFNATLKVAKTKTNKRGEFKISKTIDKARFQNYYLKVETSMPGGFIDNYGQKEKLTEYINQYQPVADLRMMVYPEAKLLIKLVKNQTDNFNSFDVSYSYHRPYSGSGFASNSRLRDTILIVKTAADVYTRITWSKNYGPGQNTSFTDSIRCFSSKDNVFVINY
ncbi:hypothetical protein [Adhaeribacter pallidiroseus]|uniref:Uncharacterized protein n=1 Tax=Adhaeribacter pallidiroseus TaxID=2072847 RepID=A0A369QRL3_9BACT|nr:hypothetical protein [Adhaeribacter pallidiroseus]RDC64828.1 hypothetical protein AHMF7616_03448 [Adhaeribacter pallidiroseus]